MARAYLAGFNAPLPVRTRAIRVVVVLILCTWWGLASFSGYRAIYQVQGLEIDPPRDPLTPGTVIHAEIVTSGRTVGWLKLVLIQGDREDTIGSRTVRGNRDGAMDQRYRRALLNVRLSNELLASYRPGPATLRAVGLGSSQFLRVPPPVVREISVTIHSGRGQAMAPLGPGPD